MKRTPRRGGTPGCWSPRSSCITRAPSSRAAAIAIWRRGSAARSPAPVSCTNSAFRRTFAQRTDYFHDELVRTLANGDASLLEVKN